MSGRRRPSTTRAEEGQLSLLGGILTEQDRAMLELARGGPGLQARVADQAQRLLGLSPTRYFQLLGRLLDRPEAFDAEPELVAGLRAAQDHRRRLRRLAYRRLTGAARPPGSAGEPSSAAPR